VVSYRTDHQESSASVNTFIDDLGMVARRTEANYPAGSVDASPPSAV
jgi:hypothetical protein